MSSFACFTDWAEMKANLRGVATTLLIAMTLLSSAGCTQPRPTAGNSAPAPAVALAPTDVPATIPAAEPAPPTQPEDILRLRAAISTYQKLLANGDWPRISAPSKLEVGDTGDAVRSLRVRLVASGDLTATTESNVFDADLDAALRRFQQRHGLSVDGKLGPKSLAALNVPISERLRTLEINLDRQLAERRQWGMRYIVVNTAATTYRLVEAGETVFERRVIVGRPNWPTPPLHGAIDTIVFHPTWTVPPRIARLELMPRIRREPGYMAEHHMRLVDGMIRQAAGPDNPLGKLKFVFPNDDSIYLHDTNAPSLFEKAERHLSHGCIRVSNAEELARHLLAGEPGWSDALISEKLARVQTENVRLTRSIPVHIVYDTAWVDPDGTVNFRDDVYDRDGAR
jgi:murein L,D-transpeptidase YcbB/YkuD